MSSLIGLYQKNWNMKWLCKAICLDKKDAVQLKEISKTLEYK
nr:MAG TPA: hypothetical protein [Caudoviricetes sp.]